jgi:hypothetical protein
MEQVACEEHHVHIAFPGKAHHLVEAFPAVISSDWISLVVPDMVVG